MRWFELSLVLVVAFGNSILSSLHTLIYGPNSAAQTTNSTWLIGFGREVVALSVLGYVLHRQGLRFKSLGLGWSFRELGVGGILIVLSRMAFVSASHLIQRAHFAIWGVYWRGRSPAEIFGHPSLIAVPYFLLNPFFEELIVRAFLMTEVIALTGSESLAIWLSVGLQFSYHLYYGWVPALALACQFLVLALYFARWRRALPLIVAHEFSDISGLIRLW